MIKATAHNNRVFQRLINFIINCCFCSNSKKQHFEQLHCSGIFVSSLPPSPDPSSLFSSSQLLDSINCLARLM